MKPRRINPPHYFLGALAAMVLLARLPGPSWPPGAWRFAGLIPIGCGLAIALVAARRFARAGTNIVPLTPSSALVTDGPFAYSRNPMYLGMLLVLAGVALLTAGVWSWCVPPAFASILWFRFVRHEERLMAATFGDAYAAYRARTRRWF